MMSEPHEPMRARVRRLIEASAGYPWLEPVAKIAFGAMLLAALLFAVFLLVR